MHQQQGVPVDLKGGCVVKFRSKFFHTSISKVSGLQMDAFGYPPTSRGIRNTQLVQDE